jgi:hypothetical protein
MAFNGSGTFVRLYSWVADLANAIKIRSDRMDAEMDGFAAGLSMCIAKNGESTTTQRIPFAAGIQLNTGAVSAPSLNFSADSDTGIYSPASDQWAVTTGGTQRFLVNSGAISVTGTFAVSGASTLTGNVSCGGTLAVTGASTLTGAVSLSNNLSVGGAITLTGAQSIGTTLTVTGPTAG